MKVNFIPDCRIVFILILSFNFCRVLAQTGNNNLEKDLNRLKDYTSDDTGKVNLLNRIAGQHKTSDPELAKNYFHKAAALAEEIRYNTGDIEANENLGALFKDRAEYDSSLYFYLKCLKLRDKNDNAGSARDYKNIGAVYLELDDSLKAANYLRKGLELSKNAKDTLVMGKIYIDLGNLYQGYGQNDMARSFYFLARDIFQRRNDKAILAKVFNNIGGSFYRDKNYKTSLLYFFQKAKIEKELNDDAALAYAYNNIATSYANINNDSALYYFNQALSLSKKIKNPSILMRVYGNLADFYEKIHEFQKSENARGRYYDLKDSLFSVEKTKAIADIQTKYETEKKEQQIKILTGDKKFSALLRNFLLVALAFILIVALFILSRYRYVRRLNKIIDAEKSRSDELLLNILPAETADELKKYGKTTAKNYDEVSVLFVDVKGFSNISLQMTAQALVADLDKYFGSFDLICERFGLEKIKTIGDAYLAAGGLPNPNKGTPEEVVKAALEMQKYAELIKQESIIKNVPYFDIRVGIHTGPIVAGVVGIKKFAYDIWGDTVNTAARMEQYGEAGKVNISEHTYEKIKDIFNCTYRGNIEVKNKGIFPMYFVDGLKI
jgi:adenylate cyclase